MKPTNEEPRDATQREIEVIALEPNGFTSRKVDNIRQAALYAEWLLETGATRISIRVSQVMQENERCKNTQ